MFFIWKLKLEMKNGKDWKTNKKVRWGVEIDKKKTKYREVEKEELCGIREEPITTSNQHGYFINSLWTTTKKSLLNLWEFCFYFSCNFRSFLLFYRLNFDVIFSYVFKLFPCLFCFIFVKPIWPRPRRRRLRRRRRWIWIDGWVRIHSFCLDSINLFSPFSFLSFVILGS